MSVQFAPEIEDEQRIAEVWLAEFADALVAGDAGAAAAQFVPDGHWRDVLAFTWNLTPLGGRDSVAARGQDVDRATAGPPQTRPTRACS
jgi:putative flavoprotein involved in K+ transport